MDNQNEMNHPHTNKVTLGLMLIAIGIVYGDIGTSPMYVMKSILEGNGGIAHIDESFIIGAFSLVIWTITLLTTIQFVLIAMKADNNGEGGIFALYSLVRKYGKWLIVVTMIGGATMLADGILTPAVTVTNAIDGLKSIESFNRVLGSNQWYVVGIVLVILAILFGVQHAGTSKIGTAFGPAMLVWFLFLGITGALNMTQDLSIWKAVNPIYAIRVLTSPNNKVGFMILGSVFLATTGAEALYSDMGHVGRGNIYASWPFVKICLLLNYAGQCAWIISHQGDTSLYGIESLNPFFQMLPVSMRAFAVVLSAIAAVIASQALITGSYTLVSEAITLDLLPHMQIRYPSVTKGQLYISLVNSIMWVGTSFVVIYFRYSSRMENAYGLAITVSMLMTTLLLVVYLMKIKGQNILGIVVGIIFGALEFAFFISSCGKFVHGGYIAVIISLILFGIMLVWYRGTQIEQEHRVTLRMRDHVESINALRLDNEIPKFTDNMVFFSSSKDPEEIERDVLYSILDKDAKRSSAYWFLHVDVTNQPYDRSYTVEKYGTDYMYFVNFHLGFKMDQRVNVYLRQVVSDLMASGELPKQNKKHSIYGPSPVGNFKFCMVRTTLPNAGEISSLDAFVLSTKYAIRRAIGGKIKWYGLENSLVITEYVPLIITHSARTELIREERG